MASTTAPRTAVTLKLIEQAYLSPSNQECVYAQLATEIEKGWHVTVQQLYPAGQLRTHLHKLMTHLFSISSASLQPAQLETPKKTVVLLNAIAIKKVLAELAPVLAPLKKKILAQPQLRPPSGIHAANAEEGSGGWSAGFSPLLTPLQRLQLEEEDGPWPPYHHQQQQLYGPRPAGPLQQWQSGLQQQWQQQQQTPLTQEGWQPPPPSIQPPTQRPIEAGGYSGYGNTPYGGGGDAYSAYNNSGAWMAPRMVRPPSQSIAISDLHQKKKSVRIANLQKSNALDANKWKKQLAKATAAVAEIYVHLPADDTIEKPEKPEETDSPADPDGADAGRPPDNEDDKKPDDQQPVVEPASGSRPPTNMNGSWERRSQLEGQLAKRVASLSTQEVKSGESIEASDETQGHGCGSSESSGSDTTKHESRESLHSLCEDIHSTAAEHSVELFKPLFINPRLTANASLNREYW